MTRLLISLLLGISILPATSGLTRADAVKVGVAAEPYPPFASTDPSGKWIGWEVEFVDALCKQAALDCEVVAMPWDGIIAALKAKKIDVIAASMAITDEREKEIDFSDRYYNVAAAIVGRKDVDIAVNEMTGRRLGLQTSTIHQRYAEKYYQGADVSLYQTQDEAFQDLAAGRIDATQADQIAISAFLATDQGKACCEEKQIVPDDPEILGRGVGLGIRKGDGALKEKLNMGIKEMRSNGEYKKISDKYFDFDVYGSE